MKRFFQAGFLLVSLLSSCVHANSPELPGWQQSHDESKNALVYTAGDDSGAIIKIYPTVPIEADSSGNIGNKVQHFVLTRLTSNNAPKGTWRGQPNIKRLTLNAADGYRKFDNGTVYAFAVSTDNEYARLGVLIFNNKTDKNTVTQASQFLAPKVWQLEKDDAKKHKRAIKIEASPPDVKGLTTGTTFKPGLYVGERTYAGKLIRSIKILFYDNGEYEYLSGAPSGKSGTYTYSHTNGKFDAGETFFNSTVRPAEKYSVYGMNEDDIPMVFASRAFGFNNHITRVRWQEPVDSDRLTPIQRADAEKQQKEKEKAIAKAERRAKKGGVEGLASLRDRAPLIPNSAISGVGIKYGNINYEFDPTSGFAIPQVRRVTPYLALKDGTVIPRPAPPADTDLDKFKKLNGKSKKKIYVAGPTFRGLLLDKEGNFKLSSTTLMMSADLGFSPARGNSSKEISGSYFIDGNTIELKHNGKIDRLLFGTDGKEKVLMAATEYLVKKK